MTRLFLYVRDNGDIVPVKRDCDRWTLAEDGTVTIVDVAPVHVAALGWHETREIRSVVKNVVHLSVVRTDAAYAQEGPCYARR